METTISDTFLFFWYIIIPHWTEFCVYISILTPYMYELNKLNLEEEKLKNSKLNSYNLDWIENFKSIKKIDVIDRNIVDCFIKNIFIREDGNIEIYFRYNDQYKFALEYLNNKKI